MLENYQIHLEKRQQQGLPPLPLNAKQTTDLINLLKNATDDKINDKLLQLFSTQVPAGVDDAAKIKADFLYKIANGVEHCALIDPKQATFFLGTMLGGFNITYLIDLLDNKEVAKIATESLSKSLLIYDAWHTVVQKSTNNSQAKKILNSWAEAEWFLDKKPLAEKLTLTVFKVDGEINTDDLSPASQASTRPDIPLHAQSMLQNKITKPLEVIEQLKTKGYPLVFVGDVVGTGSSRKSAINSLLWHIGKDIPYIPNKKQGGVILGGKIAPIFFNTAEDSGTLVIECNVNKLNTGNMIHIYPKLGKIESDSGELLTTFNLYPETIADEIRAGGRIPLIIGRELTNNTRKFLNLPPADVFTYPKPVKTQNTGFTLAQKIIGKACGMPGILPGAYCEPKITTVGSQDTTGGMTRDELKELACLKFSADLVMQSFCHTAAYPNPIDIQLQQNLPKFITNRGGVSLRPGDGIIHSWLNRMLLPDTVGTGADSHTRFPIGISFPAGSGLVAFAATLGMIPIDMPESVLVRFKGTIQPGITLRDLVNAIPYVAIQKGLLTIEKSNKKNIFSGKILEIEGLPDLKVEQAFELSDASAERSTAACTIRLNKKPVIEYLKSNIVLLQKLITDGYENKITIKKRIDAMQKWLENPKLLIPDGDAHYAEVIEINLDEIKEPIVACPNDPDDVKLLSAISGNKIDEVFIGSCMTNIGHYRAATKILENTTGALSKLWIAPPTRMDAKQLINEGHYAIFGKAGARMETPGCSLCMGNQARVADGSTVMSTSTRNFPNRLGKDAQVYLGSAELAAVVAKFGRFPTIDEYLSAVKSINNDQVYQNLTF